MRTLLRHAATGQYYEASGKWTTNPKKAHDFEFISRAMKVVRKTRSRYLELDLSFDNRQDTASIRLQELLAGA